MPSSTSDRAAASPPAMNGAARSRLIMQGFACDIDPRITAAAPWLRFTPTLSALCVIAGTALRSPAVLWAFAVVAAIGATGWNGFDWLFNALVRHWVGADALPPNPAPRRFAMAAAAAWSAGAGLLMATGSIGAGVVAGSGLAVAAVLVATTHFCLGSWLYQLTLGRS